MASTNPKFGTSRKVQVMKKIIARAIFAACVLVTTAANAAWPDRTVTLIVPYAAGGISDVLARLTAEQLQARFKQTFIVQNEVGAGGIIGTANAAHAKPDGYTLLFGPIALLTLSPLTTKVNYDPDKDFEPVSIVASTPFVVTVNEGFPANTLVGIHRRGEERSRASTPMLRPAPAARPTSPRCCFSRARACR